MKQFLEWRDDWNLGLQAIDQQHRSLVAILNRVADVLNGTDYCAGRGEPLLPLLRLLLEETRQHFSDEENTMWEHDYPLLTGHRRDHLLLLAELLEFMREVEANRKQFDLDSLTSLKHWLIDHVINRDLEFARFLNALDHTRI